MALLHFPHQSPFFSVPKPPNHSKSQPNLTNLCFRFSPSHSLTNSLHLKPERFSRFIARFSVSAQHPVTELQSESHNREEEEFSRTRLIAQNVPWTCTVEDIRCVFQKHGKVLDVELSMYNKTLNRGLAFVSMGSPEEAIAALNNLEAYELEGRALKLSYARPRKKKVEAPVKQKAAVTFNLFVANLSYEARAKNLREFFEFEGRKVVSAQVIFHENPRRSSGYGFVAFKSKKEAEAALDAFQGKIFMGRPIRVARARQFVKVQSEHESTSDDSTTDFGSGPQQAEVTDQC